MLPVSQGTICQIFFIICVVLLIDESNSEGRVVCYYTNWSVYRPGTAKFNPQNINPYLCTHLIYAFGGFTKDNTLKPFDKYQDIEQGGYAKFTGLKSYNKQLKTLLAIGGWNEASSRFSPLVANPERRQQFIKNILKFLRQNHFDGLDLDWEYPAHRDGGKSRDKDNYAQFVQDLRAEFDRESSKTGRPRLLLTMAVPAGIEYIEKGYDIPKLNKYLDWFNILSYDYHSAYEPSVNHHAPLYSLEDDSEYNYDGELNIDYTVKYYLSAGAEKDKLVLGIPTYGRSYTLINEESTDIGSPSDGPGEQGDATREKGYMAYYEICQNIRDDPTWQVMQPNPKAMGPYAYKNNQWVGYDDEAIVRKKGEYVANNSLGGIMFWSIDNDDFRGLCTGKPYPLIEAAKEALLDNLRTDINEVSKPINSKKLVRTRTRANSTNRNKITSTATLVKDVGELSKKDHTRRPSINRKHTTTQIPTTTLYNGRRTTTPEPPTTPDPGSDFKCEEEGFFQHPRDCKKYFWCLDSGPSNLGIVAHQFTCPSGLYFNPAADSCDFSRNVLCNKKSSKNSSTTTTTTATTIKSQTTTTTSTNRPKLTAATNRNSFRSSFPSTTTTEYAYEYEDEDEEEDKAKEEEETHYGKDNGLIAAEEDPKVIKELISLIKKVGGIEELEKLLEQDSDAMSLKTEKLSLTTESTISKSLYDKVLRRPNSLRSFQNKFNDLEFQTKSKKIDTTEEKTDIKSTINKTNNKYSSIVRNSRPTAQNDGIEKLSEFSGFLKEKPKYVTITRTTPSKTNNENLPQEDIDHKITNNDDDYDYDQKYESKSTTPSYSTIRRFRPFSIHNTTQTKNETADNKTDSKTEKDTSKETEIHHQKKTEYNEEQTIETNFGEQTNVVTSPASISIIQRISKPVEEESSTLNYESKDDELSTVTVHILDHKENTTLLPTKHNISTTPRVYSNFARKSTSSHSIKLSAENSSTKQKLQSNSLNATLITLTTSIPITIKPISSFIKDIPTIVTTPNYKINPLYNNGGPNTTLISILKNTTEFYGTTENNFDETETKANSTDEVLLTNFTKYNNSNISVDNSHTNNTNITYSNNDILETNTIKFNKTDTKKTNIDDINKIEEFHNPISTPKSIDFHKRRGRPTTKKSITILTSTISDPLFSNENEISTKKVSLVSPLNNTSKNNIMNTTVDLNLRSIVDGTKVKGEIKNHNLESSLKTAQISHRKILFTDSLTKNVETPSIVLNTYSWKDPRIGNFRPWHNKLKSTTNNPNDSKYIDRKLNVNVVKEIDSYNSAQHLRKFNNKPYMNQSEEIKSNFQSLKNKNLKEGNEVDKEEKLETKRLKQYVSRNETYNLNTKAENLRKNHSHSITKQNTSKTRIFPNNLNNNSINNTLLNLNKNKNENLNMSNITNPNKHYLLENTSTNTSKVFTNLTNEYILSEKNQNYNFTDFTRIYNTQNNTTSEADINNTDSFEKQFQEVTIADTETSNSIKPFKIETNITSINVENNNYSKKMFNNSATDVPIKIYNKTIKLITNDTTNLQHHNKNDIRHSITEPAVNKIIRISKNSSLTDSTININGLKTTTRKPNDLASNVEYIHPKDLDDKSFTTDSEIPISSSIGNKNKYSQKRRHRVHTTAESKRDDLTNFDRSHRTQTLNKLPLETIPEKTNAFINTEEYLQSKSLTTESEIPINSSSDNKNKYSLKRRLRVNTTTETESKRTDLTISDRTQTLKKHPVETITETTTDFKNNEKYVNDKSFTTEAEIPISSSAGNVNNSTRKYSVIKRLRVNTTTETERDNFTISDRTQTLKKQPLETITETTTDFKNTEKYVDDKSFSSEPEIPISSSTGNENKSYRKYSIIKRLRENTTTESGRDNLTISDRSQTSNKLLLETTTETTDDFKNTEEYDKSFTTETELPISSIAGNVNNSSRKYSVIKRLRVNTTTESERDNLTISDRTQTLKKRPLETITETTTETTTDFKNTEKYVNDKSLTSEPEILITSSTGNENKSYRNYSIIKRLRENTTTESGRDNLTISDRSQTSNKLLLETTTETTDDFKNTEEYDKSFSTETELPISSIAGNVNNSSRKYSVIKRLRVNTTTESGRDNLTISDRSQTSNKLLLETTTETTDDFKNTEEYDKSFTTETELPISSSAGNVNNSSRKYSVIKRLRENTTTESGRDNLIISDRSQTSNKLLLETTTETTDDFKNTEEYDKSFTTETELPISSSAGNVNNSSRKYSVIKRLRVNTTTESERDNLTISEKISNKLLLETTTEKTDDFKNTEEYVDDKSFNTEANLPINRSTGNVNNSSRKYSVIKRLRVNTTRESERDNLTISERRQSLNKLTLETTTEKTDDFIKTDEYIKNKKVNDNSFTIQPLEISSTDKNKINSRKYSSINRLLLKATTEFIGDHSAIIQDQPQISSDYKSSKVISLRTNRVNVTNNSKFNRFRIKTTTEISDDDFSSTKNYIQELNDNDNSHTTESVKILSSHTDSRRKYSSINKHPLQTTTESTPYDSTIPDHTQTSLDYDSLIKQSTLKSRRLHTTTEETDNIASTDDDNYNSFTTPKYSTIRRLGLKPTIQDQTQKTFDSNSSLRTRFNKNYTNADSALSRSILNSSTEMPDIEFASTQNAIEHEEVYDNSFTTESVEVSSGRLSGNKKYSINDTVHSQNHTKEEILNISSTKENSNSADNGIVEHVITNYSSTAQPIDNSSKYIINNHTNIIASTNKQALDLFAGSTIKQSKTSSDDITHKIAFSDKSTTVSLNSSRQQNQFKKLTGNVNTTDIIYSGNNKISSTNYSTLNASTDTLMQDEKNNNIASLLTFKITTEPTNEVNTEMYDFSTEVSKIYNTRRNKIIPKKNSVLTENRVKTTTKSALSSYEPLYNTDIIRSRNDQVHKSVIENESSENINIKSYSWKDARIGNFRPWHGTTIRPIQEEYEVESQKGKLQNSNFYKINKESISVTDHSPTNLNNKVNTNSLIFTTEYPSRKWHELKTNTDPTHSDTIKNYVHEGINHKSKSMINNNINQNKTHIIPKLELIDKKPRTETHLNVNGAYDSSFTTYSTNKYTHKNSVTNRLQLKTTTEIESDAKLSRRLMKTTTDFADDDLTNTEVYIKDNEMNHIGFTTESTNTDINDKYSLKYSTAITHELKTSTEANNDGLTDIKDETLQNVNSNSTEVFKTKTDYIKKYALKNSSTNRLRLETTTGIISDATLNTRLIKTTTDFADDDLPSIEVNTDSLILTTEYPKRKLYEIKTNTEPTHSDTITNYVRQGIEHENKSMINNKVNQTIIPKLELIGKKPFLGQRSLLKTNKPTSHTLTTLTNTSKNYNNSRQTYRNLKDDNNEFKNTTQHTLYEENSSQLKSFNQSILLGNENSINNSKVNSKNIYNVSSFLTTPIYPLYNRYRTKDSSIIYDNKGKHDSNNIHSQQSNNSTTSNIVDVVFKTDDSNANIKLQYDDPYSYNVTNFRSGRLLYPESHQSILTNTESKPQDHKKDLLLNTNITTSKNKTHTNNSSTTETQIGRTENHFDDKTVYDKTTESVEETISDTDPPSTKYVPKYTNRLLLRTTTQSASVGTLNKRLMNTPTGIPDPDLLITKESIKDNEMNDNIFTADSIQTLNTNTNNNKIYSLKYATTKLHGLRTTTEANNDGLTIIKDETLESVNSNSTKVLNTTINKNYLRNNSALNIRRQHATTEVSDGDVARTELHMNVKGAYNNSATTNPTNTHHLNTTAENATNNTKLNRRLLKTTTDFSDDDLTSTEDYINDNEMNNIGFTTESTNTDINEIYTLKYSTAIMDGMKISTEASSEGLTVIKDETLESVNSNSTEVFKTKTANNRNYLAINSTLNRRRQQATTEILDSDVTNTETNINNSSSTDHINKYTHKNSPRQRLRLETTTEIASVAELNRRLMKTTTDFPDDDIPGNEDFIEGKELNSSNFMSESIPISSTNIRSKNIYSRKHTRTDKIGLTTTTNIASDDLKSIEDQKQKTIDLHAKVYNSEKSKTDSTLHTRRLKISADTTDDNPASTEHKIQGKEVNEGNFSSDIIQISQRNTSATKNIYKSKYSPTNRFRLKNAPESEDDQNDTHNVLNSAKRLNTSINKYDLAIDSTLRTRLKTTTDTSDEIESTEDYIEDEKVNDNTFTTESVKITNADKSKNNALKFSPKYKLRLKPTTKFVTEDLTTIQDKEPYHIHYTTESISTNTESNNKYSLKYSPINRLKLKTTQESEDDNLTINQNDTHNVLNSAKRLNTSINKYDLSIDSTLRTRLKTTTDTSDELESTEDYIEDEKVNDNTFTTESVKITNTDKSKNNALKFSPKYTLRLKPITKFATEDLITIQDKDKKPYHNHYTTESISIITESNNKYLLKYSPINRLKLKTTQESEDDNLTINQNDTHNVLNSAKRLNTSINKYDLSIDSTLRTRLKTTTDASDELESTQDYIEDEKVNDNTFTTESVKITNTDKSKNNALKFSPKYTLRLKPTTKFATEDLITIQDKDKEPYHNHYTTESISTNTESNNKYLLKYSPINRLKLKTTQESEDDNLTINQNDTYNVLNSAKRLNTSINKYDLAIDSTLRTRLKTTTDTSDELESTEDYIEDEKVNDNTFTTESVKITNTDKSKNNALKFSPKYTLRLKPTTQFVTDDLTTIQYKDKELYDNHYTTESINTDTESNNKYLLKYSPINRLRLKITTESINDNTQSIINEINIKEENNKILKATNDDAGNKVFNEDYSKDKILKYSENQTTPLIELSKARRNKFTPNKITGLHSLNISNTKISGNDIQNQVYFNENHINNTALSNERTNKTSSNTYVTSKRTRFNTQNQNLSDSADLGNNSIVSPKYTILNRQLLKTTSTSVFENLPETENNDQSSTDIEKDIISSRKYSQFHRNIIKTAIPSTVNTENIVDNIQQEEIGNFTTDSSRTSNTTENHNHNINLYTVKSKIDSINSLQEKTHKESAITSEEEVYEEDSNNDILGKLDSDISTKNNYSTNNKNEMATTTELTNSFENHTMRLHKFYNRSEINDIHFSNITNPHLELNKIVRVNSGTNNISSDKDNTINIEHVEGFKKNNTGTLIQHINNIRRFQTVNNNSTIYKDKEVNITDAFNSTTAKGRRIRVLKLKRPSFNTSLNNSITQINQTLLTNETSDIGINTSSLSELHTAKPGVIENNYTRKLIRKRPVTGFNIHTESKEEENITQIVPPTKHLRKVIKKIIRPRINKIKYDVNNSSTSSTINNSVSSGNLELSSNNTGLIQEENVIVSHEGHKPQNVIAENLQNNKTLIENLKKKPFRRIYQPKPITAKNFTTTEKTTTRTSELKLNNYYITNSTLDTKKTISTNRHFNIPKVGNRIQNVQTYRKDQSVDAEEHYNVNEDDDENGEEIDDDENDDENDEEDDDDENDEEIDDVIDEENDTDNYERHTKEKLESPFVFHSQTRHNKTKTNYVGKLRNSGQDNLNRFENKKQFNSPTNYNKINLKTQPLLAKISTKRPRVINRPSFTTPFPIQNQIEITKFSAPTNPSVFRSTNTRTYERKYFPSSTENNSQETPQDNPLLEDVNIDALNARNKKIFEITSKKHTTSKPKPLLSEQQPTTEKNTINENDTQHNTTSNLNNSTELNNLNHLQDQVPEHTTVQLSPENLKSSTTNIELTTLKHVFSIDEEYIPTTIRTVYNQSFHSENEGKLVEINRVIEISSQEQTLKWKPISGLNNSSNTNNTDLKIETESHVDKLGEISRVKLVEVVQTNSTPFENLERQHLQNDEKIIYANHKTDSDYNTPREFVTESNSILYENNNKPSYIKKDRQLELPEVIRGIETSTIPLEGLFDSARKSKKLELINGPVFAFSLGEVYTSKNESNDSILTTTEDPIINISRVQTIENHLSADPAEENTTNIVEGTTVTERNYNYVRPIVPLLRPESNESSPLVISIANLDKVILSKIPKTDSNTAYSAPISQVVVAPKSLKQHISVQNDNNNSQDHSNTIEETLMSFSSQTSILKQKFRQNTTRPILSVRRRLVTATNLPKYSSINLVEERVTTLPLLDETTIVKYNRRTSPVYRTYTLRPNNQSKTTLQTTPTYNSNKANYKFVNRRPYVRSENRKSTTINLDPIDTTTVESNTFRNTNNALFRRRYTYTTSTNSPNILTTLPVSKINIDQEAGSSIQDSKFTNNKINMIVRNVDIVENIAESIKEISTVADAINTTPQYKKQSIDIGIHEIETSTTISHKKINRTRTTEPLKIPKNINRTPHKIETYESIKNRQFAERTYRPIIDYDYYDEEDIRVVSKSNSLIKVILHNDGSIECLDQGNFAHPISCRKFISCAKMGKEDEGAIGWEYTCPKGLSYDPVGGICNWSSGLGCKE